jgi:hypothetical protein
MFIAFSFNGKLPSYIIECTHQARLFFKGEIYLITNDLSSEYLHIIQKYNIQIVNYEDVKDDEFDNTINMFYHKFCIIDAIGREELFIRSMERFFLLNNLMKKENLSDCLFLELDNLIYDEPEKWLPSFSKKGLSYMFDNDNICSSGLMFVKNTTSLNNLLQYLLNYVRYDNEFISEMKALFKYINSDIQILPTYWKKKGIPDLPKENFGDYGDSIFDSLPIGMFLFGFDPIHTNGIIELGKKSIWSAIDYTQDKFHWKIDEEGRRIPYIFGNGKWLRINNLHVHSKDLKSALSISIV